MGKSFGREHGGNTTLKPTQLGKNKAGHRELIELQGTAVLEAKGTAGPVAG
jgi:hypothetical protein